MNFYSLLFDSDPKKGFTFGIIATFFMTCVMLIGMASGISPIPEPIPTAIVKAIFGTLPQPVLLVLGMGAHFAYGAVAGMLLFIIAKERKPILQGLAWGVILWLIMQMVFLPLIGWGFFANTMNPKIIPATLILHLIYGGVLGFGLRNYSLESKEFSY